MMSQSVDRQEFARLFDTPHGQLLAFLDETDDGEPCLHVIGAYVGGVRPAAKISGWATDPEKAAEDALAKTDQAAAERLAADLHNAIVATLSPLEGKG